MCYPFKLKKRELLFPPKSSVFQGDSDQFFHLRQSGVRYPKAYTSALPKTVYVSSSNNNVWDWGEVTTFGSLSPLLFLYNKVILLAWGWGYGRHTSGGSNSGQSSGLPLGTCPRVLLCTRLWLQTQAKVSMVLGPGQRSTHRVAVEREVSPAVTTQDQGLHHSHLEQPCSASYDN